jgi:hypothetical protein
MSANPGGPAGHPDQAARLGDNPPVGPAPSLETDFTLELESCGNPDHDQDPDRPLPGVPRKTFIVHSLAEAQSLLEAYIVNNRLGGGNLKVARVVHDGEPVAQLSYNRRAWSPTEPRQEIFELNCPEGPVQLPPPPRAFPV